MLLVKRLSNSEKSEKNPQAIMLTREIETAIGVEAVCSGADRTSARRSEQAIGIGQRYFSRVSCSSISSSMYY